MIPHFRAQATDAAPRPARAVASADAARARRCTEALRDIAEDCTVVSEALLLGAYSVAPPNTDLLQRLISLRDLGRVRKVVGSLGCSWCVVMS
ncbi:hypothetical protein KVH14_35490 [Streptomyces olivaceus]|uniref:hypothetical protein n=1 Tax=Streptomyces olivaceus TaxID=47716 RepID=UPI001CCC1964|nr:hypothetical protein [Streptomyces olivaceus]MBZ6100582.1 hypothetical protein [Streptomyces olivaceus]